MLYFLCVLIYALAVLYYVKMIINFIICKGKEPPFLSSFGKVKRETLNEAKKFLKDNPNAKVTDLGCGTGCLLIPLAKEFKTGKFVGYEYDWLAYLIAKIKTFYIPNIFIYKKNFLKENLSEYDLVLGYWISGLVDKLADKLNNELSEKAVVISEIFEVPKLKQIKVIESSLAFKKFKVFVYQPNK